MTNKEAELKCIDHVDDFGETLWEYLEDEKQYHLDTHTHFRLPRERFERPIY